MYEIFRIFLVTGLFFSLAYYPAISVAQNYKGDLSVKKKEKVDNAAKPAPKIFSSQIVSELEAKKLDVIYDKLFVSLWLYAGTDFVYQKKLYALIQPSSFQNTRFSKEFTGDMNVSMDNLNKNYKNMLSDIERANKKYAEIKNYIKESDYKILDPLWEEKIKAFRETADKYFKMQGKFLNTYRNLIGFVLKQGGSYYYKSADKKVYFYKFGGYKFYGQSIDKLRRISFKQRELLRSVAPANVNSSFK